MLKFVLYRRLSKEDRNRKQYGFDSQMDDIQWYLKGLDEEYQVLGDFQEFVSGAADCKPEQEKALALCKETGAKLLVAKLDRFSRRVSQIALLLESKINLQVSTMPHASTFELHIFASLAQQERESISSRTKNALAAAKKKGIKLGGSNEQWKETYRRNQALGLHSTSKTKYVRTKNTLPIADKIRELVPILGDSLTLAALASRLNDNGIYTPTGKEWSRSGLSNFTKRYGIVISDKRRK